jgi:hypothetical protein
MKRVGVVIAMLSIIVSFAIPAHAGILEASGKVKLLRVHDVGTGYGPATDQIDVEVIVWLDSQPGKAFGFQLRNDSKGLAHQGMLDLLRDAFNNNRTVTIDYDEISPVRKNGTLIRVWVSK